MINVMLTLAFMCLLELQFYSAGFYVTAFYFIVYSYTVIAMAIDTLNRDEPNVVAKSVERRHRMQEIGNSLPSRVKPITYKN